MNLTMMFLLHDFGEGGGPKAPRPADPSPEGGEGEPVGDDEDEDEDEEGDGDGRESGEHAARAAARGGAI